MSVACFFSTGVLTCDRNVHQASRVVSRDPPGGELVGFEPVPKLTRGRFWHGRLRRCVVHDRVLRTAMALVVSTRCGALL
ncbi:expressed unknown protein [Ectocarpus siliculosus]|uniref:Uncharacterized protein n=1 Tax=Ectocarpus siliculosus TaxID=2880 RepID=D7FYA7_ECTSI|nr:expressed unknown protein [Ectocarpus siliculosus]|eukprot:CBJ26546.1 expressed unknown protein [Ectocarpus siliculosus]